MIKLPLIGIFYHAPPGQSGEQRGREGCIIFLYYLMTCTYKVQKILHLDCHKVSNGYVRSWILNSQKLIYGFPQLIVILFEKNLNCRQTMSGGPFILNITRYGSPSFGSNCPPTEERNHRRVMQYNLKIKEKKYSVN